MPNVLLHSRSWEFSCTWSNLMWRAVSTVRPSSTECGTTISSVGGQEWQMMLDDEQAILLYRCDVKITLYIFDVSFLDGRVPCFSWAQTRHRLGHSFWTLNQAVLLVNGRCLVLSRISWMEIPPFQPPTSNDMSTAITCVSDSCHTCASLQKFPSCLASQSSE